MSRISAKIHFPWGIDRKKLADGSLKYLEGEAWKKKQKKKTTEKCLHKVMNMYKIVHKEMYHCEINPFYVFFVMQITLNAITGY